MIYRVNSDTKRLCVRIRRNGADACCENIKLSIAPLMCEQPKQYKYECSPCGGISTVEIKREPPLTLVYDMFDRNENGEICFLLDSQFSELACGRYIATIEACGCLIHTLQLDKRDDVRIGRLNVEGTPNCCEGKNGC